MFSSLVIIILISLTAGGLGHPIRFKIFFILVFFGSWPLLFYTRDVLVEIVATANAIILYCNPYYTIMCSLQKCSSYIVHYTTIHTTQQTAGVLIILLHEIAIVLHYKTFSFSLLPYFIYV